MEKKRRSLLLRAGILTFSVLGFTTAVAFSASGELVLYDDALVAPWSDVSFGSTRELVATSSPARGAASIRVDASPWGGVSFLHGQWGTTIPVPSAQYTSLAFSILTPSSTFPLQVQLQSSGGASFSAVSYGQVPAGSTWQEIRVPMTTMAPNGACFDRVSITVGTSAVFYLDDIRFLAAPNTPAIDCASPPPPSDTGGDETGGNTGGGGGGGGTPPPATNESPPPLPSNLTSTTERPWVTAYYAGWSQGQYNNGLPAEEIDYDAVTHIIHFSLGVRGDGTLSDAGNSVHESNARAAVAAAHKAGKPILISIGGWWTAPDYRVATGDNMRAKFIHNIVNFITERGYDGVDIDWEPIEKGDYPQFRTFIRELRVALDAVSPRPLLTVATGWGAGELFADIHQYVDQVNLMTYDMAGAWQGWVVWHNTPLSSGGNEFPCHNPNWCEHKPLPSADMVVREFAAAGVPRAKLGIGIDFYGYVWSGGSFAETARTPTIRDTVLGLVEEVTGALPLPPLRPLQEWLSPPSVRANVPYYLLAQTYNLAHYEWDAGAHAPYVLENGAFVSFDNERSITDKIIYAKEEGIGGVIIWELGGAYEKNKEEPDALLQAVKLARGSSASTPRSTSTPPATGGGGGNNNNGTGGAGSGGENGGGGASTSQNSPPPFAASLPNVVGGGIRRFPEFAEQSVAALMEELALLRAQLIALTNEAEARGVMLEPHLMVTSMAMDEALHAYPYARDLTLGSRGEDVIALQQFLIAKRTGGAAATLATAGATGYFGPLTRATLAEYQATNGIAPPAGYFGPLTRAHLESL